VSVVACRRGGKAQNEKVWETAPRPEAQLQNTTASMRLSCPYIISIVKLCLAMLLDLLLGPDSTHVAPEAPSNRHECHVSANVKEGVDIAGLKSSVTARPR
jgi:hypothetical protein